MKESQALRVIDHVQEEYGTGTERYLNHKNILRGLFLELVIRVGLEPSTPSLRGSCSNQLSYRTNVTPYNYSTIPSSLQAITKSSQNDTAPPTIYDTL